MFGQEVAKDTEYFLPHCPGLVLEGTLHLSQEDPEEEVFAAEFIRDSELHF